MRVVYFSNVTENTHRFVINLDHPSVRIPVKPVEAKEFTLPNPDEPYVLILPTYENRNRSVFTPRQVIAFLNKPENRRSCVGVIATGNLNFGADFCAAGFEAARRLRVPLMYMFELFGLPEDTIAVNDILNRLDEGETVDTLEYRGMKIPQPVSPSARKAA